MKSIPSHLISNLALLFIQPSMLITSVEVPFSPPQPLSFGYFGPDSAGLIAWAVENAQGRLSTLEECLEAHPLKLV